jgi:NAD(P)-dependent dehydrogenase (short-subunit alcohol dehydrogenase family)
MNNQARFLLGMVAGAAAVLAGSQAARRRHAIDFAGRVVVITGGSRGLGLVMARQFAAEGARLCLLARDEADLARAGDELRDMGADVLTLRCDIRRRADIRAAVDRILDHFKVIDVLVNNAGVIQVGPLEHMTTEDFENSMATHFWGPLHLMYEIVPGMRRRGFGRIVNISSIGGRMAVPHLAPYCASKFALAGLSDAVRAELNQYGVRVTTVAPGLMRTGSPVNADMKGQHEAEYAWFALSSSVPGLSISAERAARQILDACRHGDPDLIITMQARLAIAATHATPGVIGRLMMVTSRVLPGSTGIAGDRHRKGRESSSRWAPSAATILTDRAA